MLEKLSLEYSPFGTLFVILVFALLMVGLVPFILNVIKKDWKGSDGYKRSTIVDKILTGFSLLLVLAVFEIALFFAIKVQLTGLLTYFDVQDNPTNVTEYYKIEQKDDLLDLKLKDKYRDLGVLQEREIVKLVKEDSNLYLIEYEGQYFEIEKEKK